MTSHHYTTEDDKKIIELIDKREYAELEKAIPDVPLLQLSGRWGRLLERQEGEPGRKNPKWTSSELMYLRRKYWRISVPELEILTTLAQHDPVSIMQRARWMGYRRPPCLQKSISTLLGYLVDLQEGKVPYYILYQYIHNSPDLSIKVLAALAAEFKFDYGKIPKVLDIYSIQAESYPTEAMWTEQSLKSLQEKYETASVYSIAEFLTRTPKEVIAKAVELGFPARHKCDDGSFEFDWRPEQKQWLKEHYYDGGYSMEDLSQIEGWHSVPEMLKEAERQNLGERDSNNCVWSKENSKIIAEQMNKRKPSIIFIMEATKYSRAEVLRKAKEQGYDWIALARTYPVTLDYTRRPITWTPIDLELLDMVYPTAAYNDLSSYFPKFSITQIESMAKSRKLQRLDARAISERRHNYKLASAALAALNEEGITINVDSMLSYMRNMTVEDVITVISMLDKPLVDIEMALGCRYTSSTVAAIKDRLITLKILFKITD